MTEPLTDRSHMLPVNCAIISHLDGQFGYMETKVLLNILYVKKFHNTY